MNTARPFHCPDAVQDARDVEDGPAFVDINNAALHYGNDDRGLLALKDTFLAIGRGEFAAVVGPSGCGKSNADEAHFRPGPGDQREHHRRRRKSKPAARDRGDGISAICACFRGVR